MVYAIRMVVAVGDANLQADRAEVGTRALA